VRERRSKYEEKRLNRLHLINGKSRRRVTLSPCRDAGACRGALFADAPGTTTNHGTRGYFNMAMNNSQIRHKNFRKLLDDFIDQHPHLPRRGMLKRFAERLDLSDRYLSHIKCDRKNIGNSVARIIEEQLKLPYGWMDREHDALKMPVDEKEKLFIETALTLFRAQPNEAREMMLDLLRQRLQVTAAERTTARSLAEAN
jgi:transcriptional regulator with XRE-family HTH domain